MDGRKGGVVEARRRRMRESRYGNLWSENGGGVGGGGRRWLGNDGGVVGGDI